MSAKRNWKGWRKLHIEGGLWHYRIHGGIADIRDPNGKGYKPDLRMIELIDGFGSVHPSRVKRFIREVILKESIGKFAPGDYVKSPEYPELLTGRVSSVMTQFPRFVTVNWGYLHHRYDLHDSHELVRGFPSPLHELADQAE